MSLCFYLPEISSWYDTSRFPGSTIDEEVEDNTTIAVLTAPRFFLVTQIHDDEDPNTPIVVVTAPSLRHGLPRIHDDDGVTVVVFTATAPHLLCGLQRIHDDKDRMIIR